MSVTTLCIQNGSLMNDYLKSSISLDDVPEYRLNHGLVKYELDLACELLTNSESVPQMCIESISYFCIPNLPILKEFQMTNQFRAVPLCVESHLRSPAKRDAC